MMGEETAADTLHDRQKATACSMAHLVKMAQKMTSRLCGLVQGISG